MRSRRSLAVGLLAWLACAGGARARGGPFDRPEPEAPPPRPASEEVSLATADAVAVRGTYWPAGRKDGAALVLVPMEGTTRSAWEPLVPALVEHGVAALAIDLRGQAPARVPDAKDPPPLPAPGSPDLYATMHEDVAAAVRFLVETKGRDRKRIGVAGAGLGAAVALDFARRSGPAVDLLVLLTPGLAYPGLPSEAHAKALEGRVHVLLLAAVEDMDRGTKRLLYTWERERNPPPLTPGKQRETARRGHRPRLRALAEPGSFGTRMLGRVPHLDAWLAAWFARHWGTSPRPVLFDGSVDRVGDFGDSSWEHGTPLPSGLGVTGRALRWGRRVMVGAEVPEECLAARVRVVVRRAGRQLDVGAIVDLPSGAVHASPFTVRKDAAPRPSIPVDALALEGQEGYEGVAPVKPSFEVEFRFPEIPGDGPYEVRASLAMETPGDVQHGGVGIDPEDPDTWAVVPDSANP